MEMSLDLASEILYKINEIYPLDSKESYVTFPFSKCGMCWEDTKNRLLRLGCREGNIICAVSRADGEFSGIAFTDRAVYHIITANNLFSSNTLKRERIRYDDIDELLVKNSEYVKAYSNDEKKKIEASGGEYRKVPVGLCLAVMTCKPNYIDAALEQMGDPKLRQNILDIQLLQYRGKTFREYIEDLRYTKEKVDKLGSSNFSYSNTNFQAKDLGDLKKERDKSVAGMSYANRQSSSKIADDMIFSAQQGHGFAAEEANNLFDQAMFKDAKISGRDNAKDGPDRIVDGVQIQSKYYRSANESIAACFRDGKYRYIGKDGKSMMIEVPSDQYDDAVKAMERRISDGQVPGVRDPKRAKEMVKKGSVTYEQAKNIAKAGNIESLTYDAVNGVVIASGSFGISAVVEFATSVWNGRSVSDAAISAAQVGLRVGGTAFLTHVIANQAIKMGLGGVLYHFSQDLIKITIGARGASQLLRLINQASGLSGAAAINSFSKFISGNIATGIVSVAVLSVVDVFRCFDRRISVQQLVKNTAVTTVGTTGGFAGGLLFAWLGPIGMIVGGMALATASAELSRVVLDGLIEDDAKKMINDFNKEFPSAVTEHILSEKEFDHVLDYFDDRIDADWLREMFRSENKLEYVKDQVREAVREVSSKRKKITDVTVEDMVFGLKSILEVADEGLKLENLYLSDTDEIDLNVVYEEVYSEAQKLIGLVDDLEEYSESKRLNTNYADWCYEKVKSLKEVCPTVYESYYSMLKQVTVVAYCTVRDVELPLDMQALKRSENSKVVTEFCDSPNLSKRYCSKRLEASNNSMLVGVFSMDIGTNIRPFAMERYHSKIEERLSRGIDIQAETQRLPRRIVINTSVDFNIVYGEVFETVRDWINSEANRDIEILEFESTESAKNCIVTTYSDRSFNTINCVFETYKREGLLELFDTTVANAVARAREFYLPKERLQLPEFSESLSIRPHLVRELIYRGSVFFPTRDLFQSTVGAVDAVRGIFS